MSAEKPFWEVKSLAEMTDAEWEALCDGCGRCCLVVLIDDETDEAFETDVACRLFDPETRRCRDYPNRLAKVKDCVRLTPENAGTLSWMPKTCAYRRLARGEGLPDWHPLITGDRASVVRAGIAVEGPLDSEETMDDRELADRVTRKR